LCNKALDSIKCQDINAKGNVNRKEHPINGKIDRPGENHANVCWTGQAKIYIPYE